MTKAFTGYYLISYTTRDGEREYGDFIIIKAKDLDEAEFKAKRLFVDWNRNSDDYEQNKDGLPTEKSVNKEWEDGYLDNFETIIKIDTIAPITTESDFEAYRKLFWVEN
jgi:hypothetical protein